MTIDQLAAKVAEEKSRDPHASFRINDHLWSAIDAIVQYERERDVAPEARGGMPDAVEEAMSILRALTCFSESVSVDRMTECLKALESLDWSPISKAERRTLDVFLESNKARYLDGRRFLWSYTDGSFSVSNAAPIDSGIQIRTINPDGTLGEEVKG